MRMPLGAWSGMHLAVAVIMKSPLAVATIVLSAITFPIDVPSTHAAGASPQPSSSTPSPPSGEIELWERGTGAPSDDTPRARIQRVDLDKVATTDMTRFDPQYVRARFYRGVTLATLVDLFAPAPALDLAILHFSNGMAVPFPFRDQAAMKRLDPFIARGMSERPGRPLRIAEFPGIPKRGARADARPITFGGNKIIVNSWWHPAVGDQEKAVFSPWSHVDTLTSIEFAESRPYYRQFDVDADAGVQRGLALFQQSCQFCHGARRVGARFGWDFVEPMPMYTYHKSSKNLLYHVSYKPLDAAERGLMMPALRGMTQEDAAALWQWLRAVATKPMPAYTPGSARSAGAAARP